MTDQPTPTASTEPSEALPWGLRRAADLVAGTASTEPSEAETLAEVIVGLVMQTGITYTSGRSEVWPTDIGPKGAGIVARAVLASTWLAERDQRMQDKGAREALAEVETEISAIRKETDPATTRRRAHHWISGSRHVMDRVTTVIAAHRERIGGDDA